MAFGIVVRVPVSITGKVRAINTLTDIVTWLFDEAPTDRPAVDRRARLVFLDTLGCMIAGLSKPEPKALAQALAHLEPGPALLPGAHYRRYFLNSNDGS